MGIYIGMFEFDGPFHDPRSITAEPGVYAILHHDEIDDEYALVDIGHTDSLSDWARTVDLDSLYDSLSGTVSMAVFYTDVPEAGRLSIIDAIEEEFEDKPRVSIELAGQAS